MSVNSGHILGQGSYGEVYVKDGKAVKKFKKLSHLIQEYLALKYLQETNYIVHAKNVDFANLELHMELYDCSLRKWLEEKKNHKGISSDELKKLIHDILLGLIELHDRRLAHGDLKPGNILVRKNPFKCVLGDCGFVSIDKYAKVERTAATYRDPVIDYDNSHDMFSLGILLLEIIGELKIHQQAKYHELKDVVRDNIEDERYRKIIYNLLHEDRNRRPSARYLLNLLYSENPKEWIRPIIAVESEDASSNNLSIVNSMNNSVNSAPSISSNRQAILSSRQVILPIAGNSGDEYKIYIRKNMKKIAFEYNINRAKKGYGALVNYLERNRINTDLYVLYMAITLMILSSIFGKSGFNENEVSELTNDKYKSSAIYKILDSLISDSIFINILLSP